jgi:hypothetical protein
MSPNLEFAHKGHSFVHQERRVCLVVFLFLAIATPERSQDALILCASKWQTGPLHCPLYDKGEFGRCGTWVLFQHHTSWMEFETVLEVKMKSSYEVFLFTQRSTQNGYFAVWSYRVARPSMFTIDKQVACH